MIDLVCNGLANILKIRRVSSELLGAGDQWFQTMEVPEEVRFSSCQHLDGKEMFERLLECYNRGSDTYAEFLVVQMHHILPKLGPP